MIVVLIVVVVVVVAVAIAIAIVKDSYLASTLSMFVYTTSTSIQRSVNYGPKTKVNEIMLIRER